MHFGFLQCVFSVDPNVFWGCPRQLELAAVILVSNEEPNRILCAKCLESKSEHMASRIFSVLNSYRAPSDWIKNITWRFPKTFSELDVVFVMGAPRSGTTLLQSILRSHSELFSIEGETGIFTFQNIFAGHRTHFGLNETTLSGLYVSSADVIEFFEKGVAAISADSHGKRFVEKTPQHILRLPFILKHFPRAHVIHIVRDGRDAYVSAKSYKGIPAGRSPAKFARYWSRCVRMTIDIESSRVAVIKYENLVRDPRREVGKIMEFLGLHLQEQQLDFKTFGSDKRAQSEYFSKLAGPIDDASVGKWKIVLSDDEKRIFVARARDALKYYGYE